MTFSANTAIDDWAEALATHLRRSGDEIREKGLSAVDFVHGDVTHIEFQDGSTARFAYSFVNALLNGHCAAQSARLAHRIGTEIRC